MKIQKQPNMWSCLPTAFAMVLDIPVNQVIQEIGHDGSEITWPELIEPFKRRSFHLQEMSKVCLSKNLNITVIESKIERRVMLPIYNKGFLQEMSKDYPSENVGCDCFAFKEEDDSIFLNQCLLKYNGVIISGGLHAAAWSASEQLVYNPSGEVHVLSEVGCFLIVK